jgi:hypothetical protein
MIIILLLHIIHVICCASGCKDNHNYINARQLTNTKGISEVTQSPPLITVFTDNLSTGPKLFLINHIFSGYIHIINNGNLSSSKVEAAMPILKRSIVSHR